MRTKNKIFLVSLLLTFLLIGCKSKQKAVDGETKLEKKSASKVIEDQQKAELNYNTISAKGHIEVQLGGKAKRVSTVFKIVKDSMIQASVRPLFGVEAIRVTFTPDSVFLLDRLKKRYVAEGFSQALKAKNIDFNFYNLQALLTNQLFVPGKKNLEKKDFKSFKVNATPEVYMLSIADKNKFTYNFAVDATDNIVSALIHNLDNNLTIQWSYKDFVKEDKYIYPKQMNAQLNINQKRIDVTISYPKLDIDKKMNVDNKLPKNYEKVSFVELVSTYLKK